MNAAMRCSAFLLLAIANSIAAAQENLETADTLPLPERVHGIESILERLAEPDEEIEHVLAEQLHPVNTSSPRDTVLSFITLTQRYYDLLDPDRLTREDAVERQRIVDEMPGLFDLRNFAPSLRKDVAMAAAVYVREVISRVGLPPIEDIPDRQQMLAAIQEGDPPAWRIGNIPLEILLIDSGSQQGRFLFSEETLRSAKQLFMQTRSFPYRDSSAEDFYHAYFLTPHLALRPLTDRLPAWMQREMLEHTVWQWFMMCAAFILTIMAIWLVSFGIKRLTQSTKPLTRSSALLLVPLFAILASYLLYVLLNDHLFITGGPFRVAVFFIYGTILAATTIFIFSLGTTLSNWIGSSERARIRPANTHLMRLGIRLLSIIAIIVVLLEGMYRIGFSLATILAGAGVTGLAVALAAQDILRNIFGSFSLLLDKPFEVGQRVKIGSHEGFVEQIGMRSTKLRLLTGPVVSIPNENVADVDIENVSMRPSIRRITNITVSRGASLEKIQRAVVILGEILAVPDGAAPGHPNEAINHTDQPPRVFFNDLNQDSLNIVVFYWFQPADYWLYLEHCQLVNNEIMRRFREEDIEFAFPTQTIHLEGKRESKANGELR